MADGAAPHVILVHRYFHPDTPPYATILRHIAEHLGSQGVQVTVLTCQPSYNRDVVSRAPRRESISPGVQVRRFPVLDDRRSTLAKGLNLVWFILCLAGAISRTKRVDRLMAASTPPVLLAAAVRAMARARGAQFVYHHQDIYPEVAAAEQGNIGPLAKAARRLDGCTDRGADAVVVLSADMGAVMVGRGVKPERIEIINNFDPWDVDMVTRGDQQLRTGPLRVTYAGNLGRFQNLDCLFAAMRLLRGDHRVHFDVIGDGVRRGELEALIAGHGLTNVTVHGYRDPVWVASFLQETADLGLVTLNPGVIRAAYPSKTLSYLRNGVPVLAQVEADSALAARLSESSAGWIADPTDAQAVGQLLTRLAGDPVEVRSRRGRALTMYREDFDKQGLLARWVSVLGSSD